MTGCQGHIFGHLNPHRWLMKLMLCDRAVLWVSSRVIRSLPFEYIIFVDCHLTACLLCFDDLLHNTSLLESKSFICYLMAGIIECLRQHKMD